MRHATRDKAALWAMLPCHWVLAVLLAFGAGNLAIAEGPPQADGSAAEMAGEMDSALAALDDDAFAARSKAYEQLERWVGEPRRAPLLVQRFAGILRSPETSFEVRERIESLARRLPKRPMVDVSAAPAEVPPATESEIEPLLNLLASDSSVERAGARLRLTSMLDRVEMISPLWTQLKRRADEPALTVAVRRELEPLLEKARYAWLIADPAAVQLPPITTEQIEGWVKRLTQPDESDPLHRFRGAQAERELLDAVARDDSRADVLNILSEKIESAPDAATSSTLSQIADFAKPGMAAEVWGHEPGNWDHRQLRTIQYLIVGLPQFNEMAQRATHFDRIDEQTAHCKSGNSLTEGDYPVRVAIPYPDGTQEIMFYLTNLPTPRRRLAYEYQIERDEAERLREISQRTMDDVLEKQIVFDEPHLLLLAHLDPNIVSRTAGAYFRTVTDRRLVTTNSDLSDQSTVHRGVCHILTRFGTHEAIPALEELGRSGRLTTSAESKYQIDWIAALAIAGRDPWPGVDAWLAKLVDLKTPLLAGTELPPEVGASAAALLLDRHGASTRPFGLVTSGETLTEKLRFIGYRFSSDRDRADVQRWWDKQKAQHEVEMAP